MSLKNVTLWGQDFQNIPTISLPQTGGGWAQFFADGYDWLGANAEEIKALTPYQVKLSDTTFPTWTPTTTGTTIKSRTANYDSFAVDMSKYEYSIVWNCLVDIIYNAGTTTNKIAQLRTGYVFVQQLFRRPSNNANLVSGNYNSNGNCIIGRVLFRYKNASNVENVVFESAQGFYFGSPSVAFANATAMSTTANINTPSLIVRANDSYMPAAMFANVDQENTVFDMRGYVVRTEKDNFSSHQTRQLVEMFRQV